MKGRMADAGWWMSALFLAALMTAPPAGAHGGAPLQANEPPQEEQTEQQSQEEQQEEAPGIIQEEQTAEEQAAEEEQIEFEEPLALDEEMPGVEVEAAEGGEAVVGHEDVLVTGTAWRRGERREYVVLFDHIPVGRQAYMFAGVGARREAEGKNLEKTKQPRKLTPAERAKDAVAVFDVFETLDVRFFGTPGRAVTEGRLVMNLRGEPLYYRVERNFDPFTRYSVNRPLLDKDDYMKHQVWLRDARRLEYGESRFRRGEGTKREAALSEKADMVFDFPLLGHLAMHFQFAPLDKLAKAKKPSKLRMLIPFERPPLELFVPQNVHAAFAPRVEKVIFRVEKEMNPEGAGFPADAKLYRISMSPAGWRLWLTEEGKMLRAETGRGLTLEIAEE